MLRRIMMSCMALAGLLALGSMAQAEVVIDWVLVGDPGNTPDTRYATPGYGGVDYEYYIGKYEVANGQYIEFLNAVASFEDPAGLYNPQMATSFGGIERTGTPGDYSYGPKDGDANWLTKPVDYVSWYDAARFANWLHNGQPTGLQTDATTEDGVYDVSLGTEATRKPGAQVSLPSEDEWYKAAYYKGGGPDAGYWTYATQSDVVPDNNPPWEDSGNSANYYDDGFAVGPPYYSTDVGAYTLSESPYGTLSQAANLGEWNEALFESGSRGFRGAGWPVTGDYLGAFRRWGAFPWMEDYGGVGFRLARIPEPGTLALFGFAAAMLLRRWRF